MKCLKLIGLTIAFCLVFIPGSPFIGKASEDSECFKCHTSAKKLIEITREIAETRPAMKSAEIEGEG
jgi:hypothetical protein